MFRLLLGLLATGIVMPALPAERVSFQVSGGYTELGGQVDLDALATPLVFDPGNPPGFRPGEPVQVDGQLPFDTEEVSWELLGIVKVLPWLSVEGGYADFGAFDSEPLTGVPIATPTLPPVLSPGLRPIEPPDFGAILVPASVNGSLDIDAWLLGVRATHALSDRTRVYGRLGGLRARFEAEGLAERFLEFLDPSDETGWFWGIGVQYQVLPRMFVGVGYTQYDVRLEKLDSYQLSLEFFAF